MASTTTTTTRKAASKAPATPRKRGSKAPASKAAAPTPTRASVAASVDAALAERKALRAQGAAAQAGQPTPTTDAVPASKGGTGKAAASKATGKGKAAQAPTAPAKDEAARAAARLAQLEAKGKERGYSAKETQEVASLRQLLGLDAASKAKAKGKAASTRKATTASALDEGAAQLLAKANALLDGASGYAGRLSAHRAQAWHAMLADPDAKAAAVKACGGKAKAKAYALGTGPLADGGAKAVKEQLRAAAPGDRQLHSVRRFCAALAVA